MADLLKPIKTKTSSRQNIRKVILETGVNTNNPKDDTNINQDVIFKRRAKREHSEKKSFLSNKIRSKKPKLFIENLLKRYNLYELFIFTIDIIVVIFDLVIIFVLYYDHFAYVENNYLLTNTNNIIRKSLLALTMLNAGLLTIRYVLKIKVERVWNELNHLDDTPKLEINCMSSKKNKKYIIYLIIEILIHIIQPYPYVNIEFHLVVIRKNVIYTLNAILFIFCLTRVYLIYKIIRYWNIYSSRRAKNYMRLYCLNSEDNKKYGTFLFLIRSNLEFRGFLCLIFISASTVFLYSLIFKVTEYTIYDVTNPFHTMYNSLWYVFQTVARSKKNN